MREYRASPAKAMFNGTLLASSFCCADCGVSAGGEEGEGPEMAEEMEPREEDEEEERGFWRSEANALVELSAAVLSNIWSHNKTSTNTSAKDFQFPRQKGEAERL